MNNIIDESKIQNVLATSKADVVQIREILAKAQELKGLNLADTAALMAVYDENLVKEIFAVANKVKEDIYGKRLVIFAPLYVSNLCNNECVYCAFRITNKALKRRFLAQAEIAKEVDCLTHQGHKRILLVAGESYPNNDFQYILDSIETVYNTKDLHGGEIRRLNVNLAPLDLEDFKRLKEYSIGTYQLFQETYHRKTYQQVHLIGRKTDYDWRITAFDRAMEAGIDDVGLGALFGLYDWRFEVLALLQHANYLQDNFGTGPHTISVPRIEPAFGSEIASHPIAPVSDLDFCKLVAILRLAIPYTGIIMSTRESPEVRRQTLALGVSQISAGSRTDPGGYGDDTEFEASQFSLGDHRGLDEVVRDVANLGYLPSFCTACYRLGRTGEDFMCLAKPGEIKSVCMPNAVSTFAEYLVEYSSPETKVVGKRVIQETLAGMSQKQREITEKMVEQIFAGKKDIYV